MRFSQCLHKGDAKQLHELRSSLHKPIHFRDLPNGQHFTIGSSKEVFLKIGNSHSVSTRTKKDAIFLLHNLVHRVQP